VRAYACRVRVLRCAGPLLCRVRLCCVIYRVDGVRLRGTAPGRSRT
jgi:hypothetical protein